MSESVLFRVNFKKRFVSGHDFSRAVKAANDEGFSPCGSIPLSVQLRTAFGSLTCQEDITCAAFNSPCYSPFCRNCWFGGDSYKAKGKAYLYEGHGFSRAVIGCALDGFSL
jgi:hypothetical protein